MNEEKDFKYHENTILGSRERLNKLMNENLDYIYSKMEKVLEKIEKTLEMLEEKNDDTIEIIEAIEVIDDENIEKKCEKQDK